jgi:hypothetical protein
MTTIVECRQCGHEFEVDVLQLAGHWWDQCPRCHDADWAPDADAPKECE